MAYSQEAYDKSDATSDVSEDTNNILFYANEDAKDDDVIYEVKIEGEKAFEEDVSVFAAQIEEKELEAYMNDLNENLSQDLLCAESVFPFEIKLLEKKGRTWRSIKKLKLQLC